MVSSFPTRLTQKQQQQQPKRERKKTKKNPVHLFPKKRAQNIIRSVKELAKNHARHNFIYVYGLHSSPAIYIHMN